MMEDAMQRLQHFATYEFLVPCISTSPGTRKGHGLGSLWGRFFAQFAQRLRFNSRPILNLPRSLPKRNRHIFFSINLQLPMQHLQHFATSNQTHSNGQATKKIRFRRALCVGKFDETNPNSNPITCLQNLNPSPAPSPDKRSSSPHATRSS